jgi:polyhydroxybutyrate depolymerase
MRSKHSFGLGSSYVDIALALVCCACSSQSSDTSAVPAFVNPDSNAPANVEVTAPDVSMQGSPEPTAGSMPAASPASETPITPQLTDSESPADPSTGAAGGDGAEPGPTDPEGASPEGEAALPRPSAMCGSGGASLSFNLPNTLFSVPASYDGSTPLPVVFAFHAAGNPNTQLRDRFDDALGDDYIVFYPKSDGNGWNDRVDAPKVDAIFDALDAAACYDQNRVFATGHSSGAQFIVQRLCAGESRWRAVAPIASSVYCSSFTATPALVIHGIGDVERIAYGLDDGDGLKDIVPYRTSNGCQETFTEVPVDGCTSGGVQVNPGCRDFDGCSEPTRWCQHDDPQYGTSHHGIPCFGARVIEDFFDSQR